MGYAISVPDHTSIRYGCTASCRCRIAYACAAWDTRVPLRIRCVSTGRCCGSTVRSLPHRNASSGIRCAPMPYELHTRA
eukprot:2543481-Rhodomonas_salina.1